MFLSARDKYLKSGFFCIVEKFSVSDRGPSLLPSVGNAAASQRAGDPARDIIVPYKEHSVARNFLQTPRCEFKYGPDLVAAHRILFDDFFNCHSVLKIFENDLNGRPGIAECPRTADPTGNALYSRAL